LTNPELLREHAQLAAMLVALTSEEARLDATTLFGRYTSTGVGLLRNFKPDRSPVWPDRNPALSAARRRRPGIESQFARERDASTR
jgi:hypothetical protein